MSAINPGPAHPPGPTVYDETPRAFNATETGNSIPVANTTRQTWLPAPLSTTLFPTMSTTAWSSCLLSGGATGLAYGCEPSPIQRTKLKKVTMIELTHLVQWWSDSVGDLKNASVVRLLVNSFNYRFCPPRSLWSQISPRTLLDTLMAVVTRYIEWHLTTFFTFSSSWKIVMCDRIGAISVLTIYS